MSPGNGVNPIRRTRGTTLIETLFGGKEVRGRCRVFRRTAMPARVLTTPGFGACTALAWNSLDESAYLPSTVAAEETSGVVAMLPGD
jgi:hypothetical protein